MYICTYVYTKTACKTVASKIVTGFAIVTQHKVMQIFDLLYAYTISFASLRCYLHLAVLGSQKCPVKSACFMFKKVRSGFDSNRIVKILVVSRE